MNILLSSLLADGVSDYVVYIAIAAAAVLLIAIIIAVIVLVSKYKKKKRNAPATKTIKDRELVADNAKSVDALIVLAGADEELVEEFKKLQEQLKYLIPNDEKKVYDYDVKIKHRIEDAKIVLNKGKDGMREKATSLITEIKVLVADRNVNVL